MLQILSTCVLCCASGLSAALMFPQTQCLVLSGRLQQLGGRLPAAGGRSAGASCGAEGAGVAAEAAPAALPTGRPKLPTWSSQVCDSLAMYGMRAPSCLSLVPVQNMRGVHSLFQKSCLSHQGTTMHLPTVEKQRHRLY